MKLYLASFLESKNFGSGRVIGIVNGDKPGNIKCDFQFPSLTPKVKIIDAYNSMTVSDPKNASKVFVTEFTKQLEEFYDEVLAAAKEASKTPIEVLPFKDGDTLASWERADFTNYRSLVADVLKKLGYEVVVN